MAGTNPGFDKKAFEAGIRFAMEMGAPVDISDRATFVFPKTSAYPPGTRLDREGRPLDPRVRRVEGTTLADLQVDCAIEYGDGGTPNQTPVGAFPATQVTLTLFKEDYEKVKTAREVIIGGDVYVVDFRPVPLGLFDVGFQQIRAHAKDET